MSNIWKFRVGTVVQEKYANTKGSRLRYGHVVKFSYMKDKTVVVVDWDDGNRSYEDMDNLYTRKP